MKNKVTHGTGDRTPPDDPEQSKRFEETARLLEVDETGKSFSKAIKALLCLGQRKPVLVHPRSNLLHKSFGGFEDVHCLVFGVSRSRMHCAVALRVFDSL